MNAEEPSTPLQEETTRHHEMFLAYLDAGFTEEQSLRLIIGIIPQVLRGSNE